MKGRLCSTGSEDGAPIEARSRNVQNDRQNVSEIKLVTPIDVFCDTTMSAKGDQPAGSSAPN